MVFRTLASQIYGSQKPEADLDFIVENVSSQIVLPDGWENRKNRFGNPKFINGEKQIDFVPLDNVYSITSRELEPTIENFLSGTPLTIQAVVYNITSNRLTGEKGLDAIQRKIVEVNNLSFAEYAAQKKGKSLNQYMQEKAEELGFRVVLP